MSRLAPIVASTLLFALSLAAEPTGTDAKKPLTRQHNVVLVIADDLGVTDLGCYQGNKDTPHTPTICGLAEQGALFTNVWAYPMCSPTRASIQTGRYAMRTLVGSIVAHSGTGPLDEQEQTLPKRIPKDAKGRPTHDVAAFGKWHLGSCLSGGQASPRTQGWERYEGKLKNAGAKAQPTVKGYFEWKHVSIDGARLEASQREGYITHRTFEDTLAWTSTRDKPFFAWVALHAPHEKMHVPPHGPKDTKACSGKYTFSDPVRARLIDPATKALYPTGTTCAGSAKSCPEGAVCDDKVRRACFLAMVESIDQELGCFLDSLGDERANTHVIFLGDNGTPPGVVAPGVNPERVKGTLFEGGIHVPLIMSGPRIEKGQVVDELVTTSDLHATILEMLTGKPASAQDSISLVSVLDGRAEPRRYAVSEVCLPDSSSAALTGEKTIRDARYKLVVANNPGGECWELGRPDRDRLYDLEADPGETKNLRPNLSEAQRGAYERLRGELASLTADASEECPPETECEECRGCRVSSRCTRKSLDKRSCRNTLGVTESCPPDKPRLFLQRCDCRGKRGRICAPNERTLLCCDDKGSCAPLRRPIPTATLR